MTNPDKNQWDSIFVSLVLGLEGHALFWAWPRSGQICISASEGRRDSNLGLK